jgi:hypothetical protein
MNIDKELENAESAARSAAESAAESAVWSAARSAAGSTALEYQINKVLEVLEG